MDQVATFLSHYGVKGMRWGVRRSSKSKPTAGYSKDAKTAASIHRKAKSSPVKVKALSNSEIDTFLKRVNLETRFTEATPSRARRVVNSVRKILSDGKTMNQAATFTNSPSGQAIRSGLEKGKKKFKTK